MLDAKATDSLVAGSIIAAMGEDAVRQILTDVLSKSTGIKVDPNTGNPPKTTVGVKSIDLIDYLLEGHIADISKKVVNEMVDANRDEIAAAVGTIALAENFSELVAASLQSRLDEKKIQFTARIVEDN